MVEMLGPKLRHRMRNRAEVIDDLILGNAEPLFHQGRADHPRIIGEFEQLAADRPGEGHAQRIRQVDPGDPAEFLPRDLEAGMVGGLQGYRLAEGNDAPAIDLGQRKAGVSATDVGDCDRPAHATDSMA